MMTIMPKLAVLNNQLLGEHQRTELLVPHTKATKKNIKYRVVKSKPQRKLNI